MAAEQERKCEYCDTVLVGRSDARFCSDQCRAAWHNQLDRDAKNMIRNTNNLLRKNRRILEKLNKDGKTKVSAQKLLAEGFIFDRITEVYKTRKGDLYYYIYDQGYLPLDNDFYLLVHKTHNA